MAEIKTKKYKISNPYESVAHLLENAENHYKTNLHTHSTYSDAELSMAEMIEGFYDNDFDILAFTDHGVLGKEWDKEPRKVPLFYYQSLLGKKRRCLTTQQYREVLSGEYKTTANKRTKKRGMQCVSDCIEANMLVYMLNHVNGFFTDTSCENVFGKENDYDEPLARIEASGGISHINHPTDLFQARNNPDCCEKKENVEFFARLFRKYKSCVGMEVLNTCDVFSPCDRVLWDKLLQILLPESRRMVWGFSNSDAHKLAEIDASFMDFVLPEYSLQHLRSAMENGTFFSISRYAKRELGKDFVGQGEYPTVKFLAVENENGTITIKGINCDSIDWISNGEIIQTDTKKENSELISTISVNNYSDKITCYIRAQLKGPGGICFTQPFICDDGNMESYRQPPFVPEKLTKKEKRRKEFYNTRIGAIINKRKMNKV